LTGQCQGATRQLLISLVGKTSRQAILVLEKVLTLMLFVALLGKFKLDGATHWASPDSIAPTLCNQALESGHANVKKVLPAKSAVTAYYSGKGSSSPLAAVLLRST